jgi:hypothetical protein
VSGGAAPFTVKCGNQKCTFQEFTQATARSKGDLNEFFRNNPNWDPLRGYKSVLDAALYLKDPTQKFNPGKIAFENMFGKDWRTLNMDAVILNAAPFLQASSNDLIKDPGIDALQGILEERQATNSGKIQTATISAVQESVTKSMAPTLKNMPKLAAINVQPLIKTTRLGTEIKTYDEAQLAADVRDRAKQSKKSKTPLDKDITLSNAKAAEQDVLRPTPGGSYKDKNGQQKKHMIVMDAIVRAKDLCKS